MQFEQLIDTMIKHGLKIMSHLHNYALYLLYVPSHSVLRIISEYYTIHVTFRNNMNLITLVLRDLHWLPVSFRLEFKIMLITYKVLHDRAPIYIQELLQLYTSSRNLRSSNRNLLVKPYFNLNLYGKQAFSVAAPELWNNLPEDIKNANLKYFFLCELMNHDVVICYLIFYLLCTFIYFVVSF